MKLKMTLLFTWTVFDPIYCSLRRLTYIDRANHNIFRVKLLTYRGKEIALSDGTSIRNKDLLVKIHLHNVQLLRQVLHVTNDVQKGRLIYRSVERSLPGVCQFIRNHPRANEIKAIFGITMLNRGCRQLGFDVAPIPNAFYRGVKWIVQMPIHLISVSNPTKRFKRRNFPSYLVMSKNKLEKIYGHPST
ncbi:YkoP family protein [Paenibacillus apiarius]|uniref:YkoP-like domain-containing protein n=1 Tax=Paenibacillus apiarius TaxID=46240 RepID=A0ABT4DTJ7_9BACL|nr:hypothetical protein [Paenibacillus apiarius]MCY9513424.1 hypothetical protein [Paenibacillus apiarius]MCY9519603.1 hypothetical protein [Paenibacillus apiarius]MCY9553340.1 hypothetical protein [Paenibacillus apiarius]MCY9557190.1 hypothetical protein [Paenibacillus apiarius]MCY9682069.1 hypothetical protein [Paenibacillus apiarius]